MATCGAGCQLARINGEVGNLATQAAGAASPDGQAKLNAYLEDYSFLIDALVSLYEATFAPRWIDAALQLTDKMIEQFWDEKDGGFFYTGKDHEQLIARNKDPHDSSVPSGNSMATTALLRLGRLTGRRDLLDRAEKTLQLFRGMLGSSPMAAGNPKMLNAAGFLPRPSAGIRPGGRPRPGRLPASSAAHSRTNSGPTGRSAGLETGLGDRPPPRKR